MTKKELEAANLALLTSLNEAIECYKSALEYKSGHLIEQHGDHKTVADLEEIVKAHKKKSKYIYQQIQSDTIAGLQFPVVLRKMWSGDEVQQWLQEQAYLISPPKNH